MMGREEEEGRRAMKEASNEQPGAREEATIMGMEITRKEVHVWKQHMAREIM